jgi:arginine/lysine/ornithine decarboxylase
MSIRDALYSQVEKIDVKRAEGRVYSDTLISCPPAIPVLMSGEIVSREAIDLMLRLGITQISVVKA